ncbi:hypothetical protein RclHR1_02150022 [Rhizophagus clarus]|uniref:Uncharacterized protein n=1 Tax=Rhizophagus clarus TaxID=94130 RepID=A0A2Z6QUR9_9GLOM|nr:hypothetical protein RclHR1_02150022 [Rhizophagus clarus]
MPLDVLGRTRATLMKSTSSFPSSEDVGNLLKLHRAGDRALQLLLLNEESLITFNNGSLGSRIDEERSEGVCLFEGQYNKKKSMYINSFIRHIMPKFVRYDHTVWFVPKIFHNLTSNQVGIPAELKHINKRRKRK